MKKSDFLTRTKITALCLLLSTAFIQGCSDDNDDDDKSPRMFSINVTNLTNNQAFSPITSVLHNNSMHLFEVGTSASLAVETLAESGDNSGIINDTTLKSAVSGNGILLPGSNETLMITAEDDNLHLSLLAMLVNTNDGFIALNSVDLKALMQDESMTLHAKVYDAGTEANNEAATDLPGQSGEGFNAARNDRDFIAIHTGIVGIEDGVTGSALNGTYRFDNPGAKIVITRID